MRGVDRQRCPKAGYRESGRCSGPSYRSSPCLRLATALPVQSRVYRKKLDARLTGLRFLSSEQAESLLSSLFTAGSSHPAASKMEPLATPPTSIVMEAARGGGCTSGVAKKPRHA